MAPKRKCFPSSAISPADGVDCCANVSDSTSVPNMIPINAERSSIIISPGNYPFMLINPKDVDSDSTALLQGALKLYLKELPAMGYSANTGKASRFLEKCIFSGKYCTLLLNHEGIGGCVEVVAAISYQIVPADTQYAEIPVVAVSSSDQRKGIGSLLYLELRRRLQSVGICKALCWGDRESQGFWSKQGFVAVAEVDKKGKAGRLPVKAKVRKALSFPGASILMLSHLHDDPSEKRRGGTQECGKHSRMWEASLSSLSSKRIRGRRTSESYHSGDATAETVCESHHEKFKIILMNISDGPKKEALTKVIDNLGGCVTSDGRTCTHVVTGKVRRTANFCFSLCSGAWIVSPDWLKASFAMRRFADECAYIVEDEEYRVRYKKDVKDALSAVRSTRVGILESYTVCFTSLVRPPFDVLSELARRAGGNVKEVGEVNDASKAEVIFIACEDDIDRALMVAKTGVRTFNTDWLIDTLMTQELHLDALQFASSLRSHCLHTHHVYHPF